MEEDRAETLVRLGAPGWDRTSNPCLRRAVLYPLSYGRIDLLAPPSDRGTRGRQHRRETERIPGFG
ncbi:hypothetical protein PUN4_830085 [Paraburkholderia unamae]|nr:hypothetical protein PUN4_830085 [Paraburkholderia unamae]